MTPPRRLGRGMLVWLITLATTFIVILGGSFYHPGYVAYRPGPAFNTLGDLEPGKPLIEVSGAQRHAAAGSLDFTTVSLYGGPGHELDLWEYLRARLDSTAEVVPYSDVFPDDATPDQVEAVDKAEMVGAQQDAMAVALRATGRPVPEKVVIAYVAPEGPATNKVREKDQITAVDGARVSTASDVGRLVQKGAAGAPHQVTLTLLRAGQQVSAVVPTRQTQGRWVMGVGLTSEFVFPVKVTVNAGDVGGPSAGMMFALGIYDVLTPGDLTGGQQIAGTGTIDPGGAVGPIGGIRFKMVGARAAGASWFLAPTSDCGEVVGSIPEGLRVVAVDTFTQAKDAVAAIGSGRGGDLAGCPAS